MSLVKAWGTLLYFGYFGRFWLFSNLIYIFMIFSISNTFVKRAGNNSHPQYLNFLSLTQNHYLLKVVLISRIIFISVDVSIFEVVFIVLVNFTYQVLFISEMIFVFKVLFICYNSQYMVLSVSVCSSQLNNYLTMTEIGDALTTAPIGPLFCLFMMCSLPSGCGICAYSPLVVFQVLTFFQKVLEWQCST